FRQQQIESLAIDVNVPKDIQAVIQSVHTLGEDLKVELTKRGVSQRPLRALIVGIPNVGKSTLINRLAHKRIARIGDRPGITRHQQWVKVQGDFELLDTPGILWPKFEDQTVGMMLAAIGTIKDQLLSLQDIAAYVLTYMQKEYPSMLEERYGLDIEMADMWDIFEFIGKRRGALQSGGQVNFDKVAEIVLRDLRTGRLGQVTLEKCPS